MDMYPILVLLGAAIGIAILAVLQWRIVNEARSFVQGVQVSAGLFRKSRAPLVDTMFA